MSDSKKVLLIGWDAADWKVINPLVDSGRMPNLKRLMESGTMGNMATLFPVLSPMLWTSIATGKRPYKHGIYGFYEPDPSGKGVRPMTNMSRRCKAIWNILNQHDLQSIVVGWWPSHPAEPINGVMVSDFFNTSPKQPGQDRKLLPGSIHPEELAPEIESLWVHPMEIGEEHVLPFIPKAREVDQESDARLSVCMRLIAECTSVHTAATHLLETQPWDFAAIYYDSIDHFSHSFMRYHPPKQEQISRRDFDLYHNVITMAYIYHDLILGRLMELAGDDTTIMLISDHGFHPDHLRPKRLPTEPAGPALEHRDYGIFVMSGPNIKKDHLTHGVGLLDVTPTLLPLFDLPVGKDMDGKTLTDVFQSPPEIQVIESWERVEGSDGQHREDTPLDAEMAQEALEQLIALGYIERPADDNEEAIARCQSELDYNLARAYMDGGMHGEAVPMLIKLYCDFPLEFRFGIQLANCLRAMDRTEDLEQLIEDLNTRWRLAGEEASRRIGKIAEIAKERRAHWRELKAIDDANKEAGADMPPLARRGANGRPKLFDDREAAIIRKIRTVARGNPQTLDFLSATVALSNNDYEAALQHMRSAEKTQSQSPSFLYHLGNVYLGLHRPQSACEAYLKSLEIDEFYPNAFLGLCRTYLDLGEPDQALTHGQSATGLKYQFPAAHYFIAMAKLRSKDTQGAIESAKIAIEQNPNFPQAHEMLAGIYSNQKVDDSLAEYHAEAAESLLSDREEVKATTEKLRLPEIDKLDFFKIIPEISDLAEDANSDFVRCLGQPKPVEGARQTEPQPDPAEVVIVSGLPRSGTSVMMQMLAAGGLSPFTDEVREADENNPKGYLEADIVKQLARNNNWLSEAEGKVVKVVSPLIPYLPQNVKYKVIIMDRNIDEVVDSQRMMLKRLNTKGGNIPPERLAAIFRQQSLFAAQLLKLHNIPNIVVSYHDVIEIPTKVAALVSEFLDLDSDHSAMAAKVDVKLYRQRIPAG